MNRAWLAPAALLLAACSSTELSSPSATQSLPGASSSIPAATPTSAAGEVLDTLPITLTSTAQHFSVDAGEYSVDWSVAGGDRDCHFTITAYHVAPNESVATLIDTDVGQEPVSGTTDFAAVAGEYTLRQFNNPDDPCSRGWSATIEEK
jgi:hypothetical protein